jgi:hypothetical protein
VIVSRSITRPSNKWNQQREWIEREPDQRTALSQTLAQLYRVAFKQDESAMACSGSNRLDPALRPTPTPHFGRDLHHAGRRRSQPGRHARIANDLGDSSRPGSSETGYNVGVGLSDYISRKSRGVAPARTGPEVYPHLVFTRSAIQRNRRQRTSARAGTINTSRPLQPPRREAASPSNLRSASQPVATTRARLRTRPPRRAAQVRGQQS